MSADIRVIRNGELMVAEMEGLTFDGIEFVDGFAAAQMVVVDLGRIILRLEDLPEAVTKANHEGLAVETVDQLEATA